MGFFDVPPPPPEEPFVEYRPWSWQCSPENVIGAASDLQVVLVRTPELAVVASGFVAYPVGIEYSLAIRAAKDLGPIDPYGHPHPPGSPDEMLQVGVQLADGGRATNLEFARHGRRQGEPPAGPVLSIGGGGGGGRRWDFDFWLWPLPPPGPLTLVVAWPALDVPETMAEVDAGPLRAAAEQAIELWPDDRPEPPASGWFNHSR